MNPAPVAVARNLRDVAGHKICLLFGWGKLRIYPLQGNLEVLIVLEKNRLRTLDDVSKFHVVYRFVGGYA